MSFLSLSLFTGFVGLTSEPLNCLWKWWQLSGKLLETCVLESHLEH